MLQLCNIMQRHRTVDDRIKILHEDKLRNTKVPSTVIPNLTPSSEQSNI